VLASPIATGIRLKLKVQPKARRNAIDGTMPDAEGGAVLKLAVTAPPEDGKANQAVIALLARELGVAKAAISVVAGATDRRKVVEIRGDPAALGAAIDALIEGK
jgi:uncharacterized protein (TIGR00251 family)